MNSPTNDFNEWLDSLGFDTSSPEVHTQAEQAAIANGDLPPEPAVQPVSFSEEDMDSLLAENGFMESHEDEPEEIQNEDSNEDVVEEGNNTNRAVYVSEDLIAQLGNIGEDRDLVVEDAAPVMEADMQQMAIETPATYEEAMAYPQREPLIPENSPTVSIDDSTSRFSGTEWYDEVTNKTVMIAGCGGIGSNLAYQIARLKPYSIVLYDDDLVELANMSGQLFKRSDIGNKKVNAVYDMVCAYTNMYNVRAVSHRFTSITPATDIMMCGFDSMVARKTYYNSWKGHVENTPEGGRKDCFFMDGRLTIDTLQVFCLTGEDRYNMERYEREFLFDDSQADSVVCSQKQTTYLACMIGSIMTNLFVNWVASSLDPVIPYKLPFFTQYEAQHMIFKTEE